MLGILPDFAISLCTVQMERASGTTGGDVRDSKKLCRRKGAYFGNSNTHRFWKAKCLAVVNNFLNTSRYHESFTKSYARNQVNCIIAFRRVTNDFPRTVGEGYHYTDKKNYGQKQNGRFAVIFWCTRYTTIMWHSVESLK